MRWWRPSRSFNTVAVGVALVGWGLPKLVGASGEKIVKKLMKAPGRGFLIFREDFEPNPPPTSAASIIRIIKRRKK
ncbi:hypothetical protein RHMOL_Rhmol09G0177200 [Rhododendron molle]|uniref:Uncharacterized protein n=1 Tax=Rhododendron molle TaxID=49168 RepID=A0ACC0MEB9_RHOML|nr:hypothetical protein RHMOL_Rhmol09G0177200 [Rhododendron molle]